MSKNKATKKPLSKKPSKKQVSIRVSNFDPKMKKASISELARYDGVFHPDKKPATKPKRRAPKPKRTK